jgi:hypothetical protein
MEEENLRKKIKERYIKINDDHDFSDDYKLGYTHGMEWICFLLYEKGE